MIALWFALTAAAAFAAGHYRLPSRVFDRAPDRAPLTAPCSHVFTACFILVRGGPTRDRIIDEIRCYIEFDAAPSPLACGPVVAVDIPCGCGVLSERTAGGALAQALMRLPCGAMPEWVVPRRDSARAFGVYATWDGIKDHPDLVELDRGDG